jgi:hypothetical protein
MGKASKKGGSSNQPYLAGAWPIPLEPLFINIKSVVKNRLAATILVGRRHVMDDHH